MTLMETAQLLGNLGELLGAIAVFVTLGFLTFQIRQSTRTDKSTFLLHIQSEFNRANAVLMHDEGMSRLLEMCREPTLPDDLSPSDHGRLVAYVHNDINNYLFVATARHNRQLDEPTYRGYCQSFKRFSIDPYPALLPLYREILAAVGLQEVPMFKLLYEEG